ncbi:MAG: SDR family oxidoreductase [Chloroflexi bacterium]|nr:SDR family oxidoreductase [Chloroflexota bacterium]GIK27809.1 MAG: 3-oxoacyl-ACP reductase [Chloroflexota bacterium]
MTPFRDRVAIVTGGGLGIGFGTASVLAERGAAVVIAEINHEAGQRAEQALTERGLTARFIQTDVTDPASVDSLVTSTAAQFGRIDVLVNNVGIAVRQAFDALTLETWNDVWLTNMTSMMLCVKACLPHLRASSRPAIVNLSSINALRTIAGMGAYPATKAAIIGFTQSLAIDLAPHIRVNAVAPGVIMTEMWQSQMDDLESAIAYRLPYIPRGRIGEAADIGKAVAFLASDDADFITGSILIVDGGQHAKLYAG